MVSHPKCPALLSIQSNANLGLKALPGPQPRISLLFRSLQSQNIQLTTSCQSQGSSGVSLAQRLGFPMGEAWPKEKLGSALPQASPFIEGQDDDGSQQAWVW